MEWNLYDRRRAQHCLPRKLWSDNSFNGGATIDDFENYHRVSGSKPCDTLSDINFVAN